MKIGFDIHGCIDVYPEVFKNLGEKLIAKNHEVHIITGQEWEKVKHKVEKRGVPYTHHFSIVDYHMTQGTKMWKDEKGTWWMDEKIWLRSKGDYIRRADIEVYFDDSHEYGQWVPESCTFIVVPPKGFDKYFHLFELGLDIH